MSSLEILREDHRRVENLADLADSVADIDEKMSYISEIRKELSLHMDLEEDMLYPLFAEKDETSAMVEHFLDEHQEIRTILEEISDQEEMSDIDDYLDEMIQTIQDHVEDEENEFFPIVERLLSSEQLEELGDKFIETREDRDARAA